MKRLLPISVALLLAAPAAALADTTTVDPASSGTCARAGTCKTITEAINVSSTGDTVKVKAATYAENVNVNEAGITISADKGAFIAGTGAGTPLTISAADVAVDGAGVFKGAGTEPAVSVTAGGLKFTDNVVAAFTGPGVVLTAGSDNRIQRTLVFASGDGVHLNVSGAGERRVTVDSSIVTSQSATAFRVTTAAASGAAFMTLNHVTSALAGKAVALDGAGNGVLTPGNITFEANSSILHGESTAAAFPGQPPLPLPAPNTVTATYVKSDATQVTESGGATSTGDGTVTPDAQLFAENLRLKSTAPVIDQGGAPATEESATDIDGDARVVGSASDLGADEYLNHPPTLTLALPASGLAGQPVTAAGTATDLEGRSDIASYRVDWGDGIVDTGAGPALSHSYAAVGTFTVSMTAIDKAGASSPAATQSITITDGTPPQAEITSPKAGASVKLTGRKPTALAVKGVHADNVAVESVEVAITRRGGGCAHYDGKAFVAGDCKKPTFVAAKLTGFRFRLDTAKLKFKAGGYQVRVRATDASGNATPKATKAAKTLVAFKVT